MMRIKIVQGAGNFLGTMERIVEIENWGCAKYCASGPNAMRWEFTQVNNKKLYVADVITIEEL